MQPANQIPVRLSRFLGIAVGGVVIAALAVPRVAQDPAYHQFADTRPLLGIPNSLNVLSNLPFALVGLEDRLPMTVGFMGLLTAILSERVSSRMARAVFVAVEEQLGLKLVPARAPVDVLVIDSIERPSEN